MGCLSLGRNSSSTNCGQHYLEDPEKFTEAFMGLILLYDLSWRNVIYALGQMLTPDLKTQVLGEATPFGVDDGQGSLVCYNPWGRKESDMTE